MLLARTAPALELAQVYARRWEHEGYFRHVKRQLRKSDVLQSHTVETAAQEIAALVLASARLATKQLRCQVRMPEIRLNRFRESGHISPLLQPGRGVSFAVFETPPSLGDGPRSTDQ